jgi:hypothetical protein
LHQLNFYFHRKNFSLLKKFRPACLIMAIVVSLLLFSNRAYSQPQPNQVNQTIQALPESIGNIPGESWRAAGPERVLDESQWTILPNADVYREYGLRKLKSRIYTNDQTKLTVEVFEMAFTSGAYGLFTFNRGTLGPNRSEFNIGRYLVSMAVEPAGAQIGSNFTDSLKQLLANDSGALPLLPEKLPTFYKIAESDKYIVGATALAQIKGLGHLKDIVSFSGGTEVVTSEYQNGSARMPLAIVEYQTPQLATDGHARFTSYHDSLSQVDQNKMIIKRVGNYVVHAVGFENAAEAQNIVDQIKYTPKVYWEGRKLSDVPINFRPPDPAAIEEASKTAGILIRAFYWIGVMITGAILIGIIAGSTFFYVRRYRRRKLGIDDLFSDAGGTIRLNLDDYLLQPSDQNVKQIGNGKTNQE